MNDSSSRPTRVPPRVEIEKRENNGRVYISAKITVTRGEREHYLSIDPRDIRQVVEDLEAIEVRALEEQANAIKTARPREYDRDGRPTDGPRGDRGGRGEDRSRGSRW